MKIIGQACAMSMLFLLGGCHFLPSLSPTGAQLVRTTDDSWEAYIVKITSPVVRAMASYEEPGFPQAFRLGSYSPNVALKPGDTVGVTVFETGGSSLFGGTVPPLMTGMPGQPAPQATTLPLQIVEKDGRILIPFVGPVMVAGRTPAQAAALIEQGLSAQAVRPQVIVSLVANTANTIAVGGEVNRAGLMPLTLRGERLLDVVAWAGGPKFPAVQTDVRVMRGNTVVSIPLRQVMAQPADNIVARPDDSITLVRNPKTFLVMGATQKVAQYTFDYEKLTLAEGIAQAGGGIDSISNMAAIFLFRYEPSAQAKKVLQADEAAVNASYIKNRAAYLDASQVVPVIYRIDLTAADGYFMAQQTALRDKDVVVVATAEAAQFLKMMQVLRALTGAYYDIKKTSGYN